MREVGEIHLFSVMGDRLALDISSGAVHRLDEVSWAVLSCLESGDRQAMEARSLFSDAQVDNALAEIAALKRAGLLYSPIPDYPEAHDEVPLVKSLCMNVAHDCNLRCSYCFASTGAYRGARSMMTPEVARAAVDFIITRSGERTTCEMDFFGGEPLMNMPVVYEAVRYARQRQAETGKTFRFTLTTNATLLTPEIAAFVNDQDMQVILSMDGRECVHDRFRLYPSGRGSHAEVMSHARDFLRSRNYTNYYVRGTYSRHNLDFASDAQFFLDNGIRAFSLEPAVVDGHLDYAIRNEDLPRIREEYEKLVAMYLDAARQQNPFIFYHFEVDLTGGPCLKKRMSGCGAGREYFAIAPDGSIYPCHQFDGDEAFKVGNVLNGTQIASGERFEKASLQYKSLCGECWARFFCGGGCHSSAWAKNKSLLVPDQVACEIQKVRLECGIYAQAVKASEQ